MTVEFGIGTDRTPKEYLLYATETMRFAIKYLIFASPETNGYDEEVKKQIRAVVEPIDALLTQIAQTRKIADEDLFAQAAGGLKQQVVTLRAVSDRIREIARDDRKPPWVTLYLEPAAAYLAEVETFMDKLP